MLRINWNASRGRAHRDYPSWNHNQIINYWWRGDINEGPDDIGFGLADNPYLPSSIEFGGRFAHDYKAPAQVPVQVPNPFQGLVAAPVQVPIEINEDLLENENEYITPPNLPQATIPASPGKPQRPKKTGSKDPKATASGSTSVSRGSARPSNAALQCLGIKTYDLDKVRPELWHAATFAKASTIPNLNDDKSKYFKHTFYLHSKLRELQQEEGWKTRTNKTGIGEVWWRPNCKQLKRASWKKIIPKMWS